jgi:hypothetical protein
MSDPNEIYVLDELVCSCHQNAQDGRFTIQTTPGPVNPCPVCGVKPTTFTLAIGERPFPRGDR